MSESVKGAAEVGCRNNEDHSEANPWTRLSSRVVYDNAWIRLREDQVLNPVGRETSYGVVHFKTRAVGILPLEEDGTIYLVGQWRYTMDDYSWEIPEGGGALDLDPQLEAQRELREEVGLEAESWEMFLELDLSNSVTDERAIVFLARGLRQGQAAPEETEVLKVKRLSLDHVFEMLDRGEIRDAISVAALMKLRLWVRDGRLFGAHAADGESPVVGEGRR